MDYDDRLGGQVLDEDLSSIASAVDEEEEEELDFPVGSDAEEGIDEQDQEEGVYGLEENEGGDDEDGSDGVPPDHLDDEDMSGEGSDVGSDTGSGDVDMDLEAGSADDNDADGASDEESVVLAPSTPKKSILPKSAAVLEDGNETETDNEFAISEEKDFFSLADLGFDESALDMSTGYTRPDVAGTLSKSPPRHSKRIEGRLPRSVYNEDDYVLSNGRGAGAGATSTPATPAPSKAIDFSPLKDYFHRRLTDRVVEYGGEADAVTDWTVEINKRNGAILGGMLDVFYVSPAGKRHRCRVDAVISLGLSTYSKTIKHMSVDEIADMANENREKQLIAYQFDRLRGECESVVREGDLVAVVPLVPGAKHTAVVANLSEKLAQQGDAPECVDVGVKMEVVGVEETASDAVVPVVETPLSVTKKLDLFFGYGNTTVLDWGEVIPNPMFHTKTQVYPIGFKCLRQEHDVLLDRTVDCYCEVLSQDIVSVSTAAEPVEKVKDVIPLFRVSVCWMLGRTGETKCVRVYEGKSPQLVWQAAMLETIGLPLNTGEAAATSNGSSTDAVALGAGDNDDDQKQVSSSLNTPTLNETSAIAAVAAPEVESDIASTDMEQEDMDEEERALRQSVMETRKEYMRALHRVQQSGNHSPVKPRLMLEALDSFFAEGILRLIEGMRGVLDCENYEFVEVRSQESGFRGLMQALSGIQANSKKLQATLENMCERADLIQRFPGVTDEELENGGPRPPPKLSSRPFGGFPARVGGNFSSGAKKKSANNQSGHKAVNIYKPGFKMPMDARKVQEDFNIKRLKTSDEKQKEEATRQQRNVLRNKLINSRKARARDVEKMMRTVRENTLKNTVVRRAEARLLVEAACDAEESGIQMTTSPFFTVKPVWSTVYAGCSDLAVGGDSNVGSIVNIDNKSNTDGRGRVVPTSLDASDLGIYRELEGDAVGSLLEIWALMFSFAEPMNIRKAPSPQVLLHSLLSCDHSYIQNLNSVNKTLNTLRDMISSGSDAPSKSSSARKTIQFADPTQLLHSLLPLDVPLMHQTEAEGMLTDLGIAFCKMLMPEFNYWMGVDEAIGILGDVRHSVNSLTWKEVARVILTSTLLQEVKADHINTATSLRGKGHTTAPDNFDKRTLRLSRRRIFAHGGGTDSLARASSNPFEFGVTLVESDYSGFEKNGHYISREKYRAICGRYPIFKNNNPGSVASICRHTTGYNGAGEQSLGICVRLPIPGGCSKSSSRKVKKYITSSALKSNLVYSSTRKISPAANTWRAYLTSLHRADGFDRILVRKIVFLAIEAAVLQAKKSGSSLRGREAVVASRLLSELLKEDSGSIDLRQRALLVLDKFPRGQEADDSCENVEIMSSVSVIEAWEYQQRQRRAPTAAAIMPLDADDASLLPEYIDAVSKAIEAGVALTSDATADFFSGLSVEKNSAIIQAVSGLSIDIAKLRLTFLRSLHQRTSVLEAPAEEGTEAGDEDDDENDADTEAEKKKKLEKVESEPPPKDGKGRFIKSPAPPSKPSAAEKDMEVVESSEAAPTATIDLADSWERERLESLSVVVKNCFNVISELMVHPMALEFNDAVDIRKFPEFYATIRRPLCFSDIRQCLLEDRYSQGSILVSFYRDVMLVLENSLAFNPEADLITQSALKVGVVFERLFFEVVLNVDMSWMPEACISCRQVNCQHKGVVDPTEAVLCDRCDGAYHLSCVDPALDHLPRGDWYCPACMHGKRVRDVHPCVGLLVHRPAFKPSQFDGFSDIGRVVDFRHVGISEACLDESQLQKRFTMRYVVMFPKLLKGQLFADDAVLDEIDVTSNGNASAGAAYELWSGDEVRTYCCRYSSGPGDLSEPLPMLPQGYTYADYDEACTIARGYVGWSSLSPGMPAALSSNCYTPLLSLLREDEDMALYQRALVALSPLSCTSHLCSSPIFGMAEWTAVLRALSRRILNSQAGRDIAASLDEEATRTKTFSGTHVSLVNLMCSLKGMFTGGPTVCEELVISDNKDEEGLMDALDDTSTDTDESEHLENYTPAVRMSAASPAGDGKFNGKAEVEELCDTDTDSEGAVERLEELMLADEPFDESMLMSAVKDPRRDWVQKRQSRRRGREDAFFTMQLLQELASKVDAELALDMEEERVLMEDSGNPLEEPMTIGFYANRSAVFQTARRLFVNRPPDAVTHPDEWLRSWTKCHEDNISRFDLLKATGESATGATSCAAHADSCEMDVVSNEHEVDCHTCQFCGFDEYTVGSTFVWGESRDEWNIATYGTEVSAKSSFADIGEELAIIAQCLTEKFATVEDLVNIWSGDEVSSQHRRKLYSAFLSAMTAAGRKCVEHDVMNVGQKKNDLVWTPLRDSFAAIELEELESLTSALGTEDTTIIDTKAPLPTIRKGKVPVHECCAEYMNSLRKSSAIRLVRKNVVLLGELVTSVRRGKIMPIGCDNNGNVYWMLPGLRSTLYINSPNIKGDSPAYYKKMFARHGIDAPSNPPPDYCAFNRCLNDDIADWADHISRGSEFTYTQSVESPFSQAHSRSVCSWSVLNGVHDFVRLVQWLKPSEYFCESQLSVVIQLLYPEIMVIVQKCYNLNTEVTDALSTRTAALNSVWSQLEGDLSTEDARLSLLTSLIGSMPIVEGADQANGMDSSDEADDADEQPDVGEESPDEVEQEDLAETESDDDMENDSHAEGHDSNKKRKRLSNGKSKPSKDNDSESGEAEADFSGDECAPSNKRARASKSGDTSTDDEDDVPVKRPLPMRRATASSSAPTAVSKIPASVAKAHKKKFNVKGHTPRGFIAPGTHVSVHNSSNGLYWDGIVRKCFNFGNDGVIYNGCSGIYCYIHYFNWGGEFNAWVPVEDVHKHVPNKQAALKQYQEELAAGSNHVRSMLPTMLFNMSSCQFLFNGFSGRWCEANKQIGTNEGLHQLLSSIMPDMCASGNAGDDAYNWGKDIVFGGSSHKDIRLLKSAMLILEASLPEKCVDTSDERWGDVEEGFTGYWRAAVISAPDAATLMECQILLEFSVRTAWLSAAGAKLLTCMPSRTYATRLATYGLVALRVFALDEAVRFELASRRTNKASGALSDDDGADEDDEDSWDGAPVAHGSSTRSNSTIVREKPKSSSKSKSKSKKAKKRR